MRTVSALDVRKHFGQLLDEAAAGEHIVIERAGEPRAALVPLDVLEQIDPLNLRRRQREALDELVEIARLRPPPVPIAGAEAVRHSRDEREARIAAAIGRKRRDR